MCFSPEVSFTASTAIAAIGVVILRNVLCKREILFASIPIFFAIQQFVEGLLWLALLNGGMATYQHTLTQIYSGYAGILWPTFGPLAVILVETEKSRKKLMLISLAAGLIIAIATAKVMMTGGISSEIMNHCIRYYAVQPQHLHVTWWAYDIATCLAFVISSNRVIRSVGLINLATFSVTYYFYYLNYVSLWCFCAAITSGYIYLYFRRERVQEDSLKHNSIT